MKLTHLLLGTTILATGAAQAQDVERLQLDPIIIGAGLAPIEALRYGRSATLVTSQEIEDRQIPRATDALRAQPGVSVSQTGAAGGLTAIRLRGAESNHTLVLIDGFEVNSPTDGSYDFAWLLTAGIDRMEILRGPQSSIYGSNAIGGVINIVTQQASEPGIHGDLSLEAGTQDTFGGVLNLRQMTDHARLSFTAARRVTEGYDISDSGGDDDGDANTTLNGRAEYDLSDDLTIGGSVRMVERHSDYDQSNYAATTRDDLVVDGDLTAETEERFGTLFARLDAFDGGFQSELSLGYGWNDTINATDGRNTADTTATRGRIALRGTFALDGATVEGAAHTLGFLIEGEEETYVNNDASLVFDPGMLEEQSRRLYGYVLEYRGTFAEALDLQASVRHDDNDDFEDTDTWSLGLSYRLPNDSTRLHASAGTAVQNPTMIEQFGYYPSSWIGNPDLKPEKSKGFDIGVEQSFWGGNGVIDVTYFRSELTDEISSAYDVVTGTSRPFNEDGTSDRQGVEVSAEADIGHGVTLAADYTWLDADDPDGKTEVRRPEHELGLRGQWQLPNGRSLLGFDLRHVAGNYDDAFYAWPIEPERIELDDYTLVSLTAQHELSDRLVLTARVENLLDEDYEEIVGYAGRGRTAYVGLRSRF